MPDPIRNMGASIRARLLNLSRDSNQSFQMLLTRYALERFLYRLSISPYRDRFVLKGAILMATWFANPFRPTQDVDFLGFGDQDPDAMLGIFREICAIQIDDGVIFDTNALAIDRVRDELEYGGLRIKTNATIASAKIRIVIDIGFGDAIEPGPVELDMTVLLDQPAPRLRSYPRETVIAEKFQAMVMLGRANSRMKDFYDIWALSQAYTFEGDGLPRAIAATFKRRDTAIPAERPDALTEAFANDPAKQRQWEAFLRGIEAEPVALAQIVEELALLLMPQVLAASVIAKG
jgi:predicted nucleotidyltransferase component of viral defense system